MRILFMGTPDIAAVCLSAIADAGHEIVGAVTQADKPKGRGYTLTPPPVKVTALERGIPVYQPATLRDEAFAELLATLNPEVIALGGVFMRNADLFMPIVDPILNREALPLARKVCRIVPAELGENIGDYAALAVAGC